MSLCRIPTLSHTWLHNFLLSLNSRKQTKVMYFSLYLAKQYVEHFLFTFYCYFPMTVNSCTYDELKCLKISIKDLNSFND